VDTWKVNESKVQEGVMKQKLTFDQLLNKYTKAVPKDRPLKKRPRSPLHQGKLAYPRGIQQAQRRCHHLVPSSEGVFYYAMGATGIVLLAQRGSTKGFGCNAI